MILSVGDESVIMDFDMEGFENSYEPTQAYHDVDIEAESESDPIKWERWKTATVEIDQLHKKAAWITGSAVSSLCEIHCNSRKMQG